MLVCGKCRRKAKGGYGAKGKDSLRNALQSELKATGHRRDVRVIETRCMGLCPKEAVTALNASRPDRLLAIPRGTGAAAALAQLMAEKHEPPPPLETHQAAVQDRPYNND